MELNHSIKKLNIDLEFENEADYNEIVKPFNLEHNKLNIALEEVFEELGIPIEEDIQINSLNLSLSSQNMNSFESLIKQIKYDLKKALKKIIDKKDFQKGLDIKQSIVYFTTHAHLPWWIKKKRVLSEEIERKTVFDQSLLMELKTHLLKDKVHYNRAKELLSTEAFDIIMHAQISQKNKSILSSFIAEKNHWSYAENFKLKKKDIDLIEFYFFKNAFKFSKEKALSYEFLMLIMDDITKNESSFRLSKLQYSMVILKLQETVLTKPDSSILENEAISEFSSSKENSITSESSLVNVITPKSPLFWDSIYEKLSERQTTSAKEIHYLSQWKKRIKDKFLWTRNLNTSYIVLSQQKQKKLQKLLNSSAVSPYEIWHLLYDQLNFEPESLEPISSTIVQFDILLARAAKANRSLVDELLSLSATESKLLQKQIFAQPDVFAQLWQLKYREVAIDSNQKSLMYRSLLNHTNKSRNPVIQISSKELFDLKHIKTNVDALISIFDLIDPANTSKSDATGIHTEYQSMINKLLNTAKLRSKPLTKSEKTKLNRLLKTKDLTVKKLWDFVSQLVQLPKAFDSEQIELKHLFAKVEKEKVKVKNYLDNRELTLDEDFLQELKNLSNVKKVDVVSLIELLSSKLPNKKALDTTAYFLSKTRNKQLTSAEKMKFNQLLETKSLTLKKLWDFVSQLVQLPKAFDSEQIELTHLFAKVEKEKAKVIHYLDNNVQSLNKAQLKEFKDLFKEKKIDLVRLIDLLSNNFVSKDAVSNIAVKAPEQLWKGHLLTELLDSSTQIKFFPAFSKNQVTQLKIALESDEYKATEIWKHIWKTLDHSYLEKIATQESLSDKKLKAIVSANFNRENLPVINKLVNVFHQLNKHNLLFGLLEFIDSQQLEKLESEQNLTSFQWSKSIDNSNTLVSVWKQNKKGLKQVVSHIIGDKYKFSRHQTKNKFLLERFVYLLNYHLLSKEDIQTKGEERKLFDQDSIKDVFNKKGVLKHVLIANQSNDQVLALLAKLSLKSTRNKQVASILNQIDKAITVSEKLLYKLYDEGVFVRITKLVLQSIIRSEILKHTFVYNNDQFKPYMFLLNFMEKLNSSNFIDLNKLNLYLKTQTSTGKEKQLTRILLELVSYNYQVALDKNISKEYFFNDLFFHILKYNRVPSWSVYKNYDMSDALSFLQGKIKRHSKEFLRRVFSDPRTQPKLIDLFKVKSIDEQVQLLDTLENTISVKLFKALLPLTVTSNIRVDAIFSSIIYAEPWKNASKLSVAENVIDQLSTLGNVNKEEIIEQLAQEDLGLIPSINTTKKSFTTNELDVLIEYFLTNNKLPKLEVSQVSGLKKMLKTALISNNEVLLKYVHFSKQDFTVFKNLLTLTSFNQVQTEIQNRIQGNTPVKQKVIQLFKDEFKTSATINPSAKASYYILNRFFTKKETLKTTEIKLLASDLVNLLPKRFSVKLIREIDKEMMNFKTNQGQNSLTPSQIDQLYKLKSELEVTSIPKKSKALKTKSLDALIYYMSFGAIPDQEIKSVKELFSLSKTLDAYELTKWKVFIHAMSHSTEKIKLVQKLYPTDKNILELIHPNLNQYQEALKKVLLFLPNQAFTPLIDKHLKDQEIQTTMNAWSKTFAIINRPNEITQKVIQHLQIEKLSSSVLFEAQNKLHDLKKEVNNEVEKNVINELEKIINERANGVEELQKEVAKEQRKVIEEVSKGAVIMIENAGLILTWPFLATLFAKLKLTDKNKFVDDYAQQKAILLSQYVINFNTDFDEQSLVLNKIICGMEITGFVDTSIEISDHEKETCNFLLNAIIQNWEKLNKTSINTLQETFLQRNGELVKSEKDFKLTVETKAFDVLLKTIPWNIGMIQTSFMKNRLLVDWNY